MYHLSLSEYFVFSSCFSFHSQFWSQLHSSEYTLVFLIYTVYTCMTKQGWRSIFWIGAGMAEALICRKSGDICKNIVLCIFRLKLGGGRGAKVSLLNEPLQSSWVLPSLSFVSLHPSVPPWGTNYFNFKLIKILLPFAWIKVDSLEFWLQLKRRKVRNDRENFLCR